MKKMTIKVIAFSIVLVALIMIIYDRYLPNVLDYPHVSKDKIIEEFKNNKNVFTELSNYVEGITDNVTIDKDTDNKFVISKIGGSKIAEIKADNKKINDNILYLLYKLKFKHVVEEGNGIYFLRQTDIGFEQGIVFSKDKSMPNWPLIKVLEPIEGNWYYYESK